MRFNHSQPKLGAQFAKISALVMIVFCLFAAPASAQYVNTFPPTGNVGLGTGSPTEQLEVSTMNNQGHLSMKLNAYPDRYCSQTYYENNVLKWNLYNDFANDNLTYGTATGPKIAITQAGRLGIGTLSPIAKLDVLGNVNVTGNMLELSTISTLENVEVRIHAGTDRFASQTYYENNVLKWNLYNDFNNDNLTYGNSTGPKIAISQAGNLGIGTLNPIAKLDVNGDINVSGNIAAKYQDFAEWVPATEPMVPGTVVVLNTERANEVMPATRPYDTTVAGVVSEKPGLILGESGASKAQIASVGRVRVKVSAMKQPIRIGDLLVTSDKSGVAMRSEPMEIAGRSFHQPGTIIGKALEPLPTGEGEILVLLSLH